MKEDLTLNIGTKYKGDGFKKVDQQLKATAKTVGTASRAIGAISSELGQMEGAVGKAAGAFSGLISTIATGGGPIGLAIAGITAAIALVVKSFKDAKEASKEAAQTMRESFSTAIDAISTRMRGIEKFFERVRKSAANQIANVQESNDLETRRIKAEAEEYFIDQQGQTTDKYAKARMKVEQAHVSGMADTNDKVTKAESKSASIASSIDTLNKEIAKFKGEVADMTHKAAQQFVTVDTDVAKEFNTLQENLVRAQELALRHGKDAVARTETRTQFHSTSGGGVTSSTYEVEVTYAQEMEAAAKKLNEFKKKNEESLKEIEAYNNSLKKIEEAEEKIKQRVDERDDLEEKQKLMDKELEVVNKEVITQRKKLEEQYKEQLEAIDKQERAEKHAAELTEMQNQKRAEMVTAKDDMSAAKIELKWANKIGELKLAHAKEELDASPDYKQQYELVKQSVANEVSAAELKLATVKDAAERNKQIKVLEKEREQLTKADNQTAAQRLAAHKAEQQAAKELADAEKNAARVIAQWAANPQQNFAQWNQQQQQAQRQDEKDRKKQDKNIAQAQNEADRIEKRIFNRNGDLRRTASAFDIGRFAEMSDFLGFKNVNEDQIDQMKDRRDELRRKLFDENGNLKRGVAENGRDVQTFKKLDKALKNVDAVKDAEKKRKEAEEREKKRAENEDKRTQSLQKIQEDIKKLTEKAGI